MVVSKPFAAEISEGAAAFERCAGDAP